MSLPPFQRFLDTHAHHVQRFLVAAVGPVDADDCFQETFLSALRAYPRLRRGTNLKAWVLTIAHRKAIDAHRSRGRRAVPSASVPDRAVAAAPLRPTATPRCGRRCGALPPKQRDAVALRYVNDLAYVEIGSVLGCSEDAGAPKRARRREETGREWRR